MLAIFAIASLYRAYGAMLVLTWNAAVWGTMLCVLGARAMDAVGTPPVMVFFGSAIGVLPHLTSEALGYCVAAIAAIFMSVALSKYGLDDQRLHNVVHSVVHLLAVSVGLLALGAALEATFAPRVLGLLSP